MALTPGTRIGSYEIAEQIGVGGMGEVYRALDTELKRQVAVKVLPEAVAADAERLTRFQREAEVLASLNHANIAAIHGLEKSGGRTALVMELVEGPTLADRIAEGPIPVDEALPIAKQVSDALEAAHGQGIVHRDLKPANIKVRPDGAVKVLDFGLAKALQPAGALSPGLSQSPTITTPAMTQAGLILGTAAYMSPEQARGKPVDRRTDIWAFGCVLYEMLTGRRAFPGEDVTDTLAAVVKLEPAWDAIPADVPARVRQTVRVCLQKDPRQRVADIHDVHLALAGAFDLPDRPPEAVAPTLHLWQRPLPLLAAAALLVVLLAAGTLAWLRPAADDVRALRASILLPEGWELALSSQGSASTSLLVSPDGERLAVIARGASGEDTILVRALDSQIFQPLSGTEGVTSMFWSPDGQSLAFVAGGTLRRVAVSGGPPATICAVGGMFGGGTWNQEGTIVFSMTAADGRTRLMRVPAGGGEPQQALASELEFAIRPWFLPDGEHVLFTGLAVGDALNPAGLPLFVARLGSADRIQLGLSGSSNVQYAQGHILFLRGGTLMAWPFDTGRLEATGDPFPVAEGVETQGGLVLYGLFSASNTGRLVYRSGAATAGSSELTWLDRNGTATGTVGDRSRYLSVELSPDDERAAVAENGAEGWPDVWIVDLGRGVKTRFTFGAREELFPVWSPDGNMLAFAAGSDAGVRMYRKASDGAGAEEPLLDDVTSIPLDWSGDLLLYVSVGAGDPDLHVQPLTGDGEPYPLVDTDFNEIPGAFSPDRRWVAYVSDETGEPAVYVARVSGAAGERARGKVRVSRGGGTQPRWRGDGRELFYYSAGDDALMTVAVDGTGDVFRADPAERLFELGGRLAVRSPEFYSYDVTRDGQRILATMAGVEPADAAAPITVIVNWTAGVE